jgi:hypothetical protein
VAAELHPDKNGDIDASEISYSSGTKVHWLCTERLEGSKCAEGCTHQHEWIASVNQRTSHGSKCCFCFGNSAICPCQSLEDRFPEVALELHPTLNGDLVASQIAFSSGKKVVWCCGTCNHEWKASVKNRTSHKTGCPNCRRKETKSEEQLEKLLDEHPLVKSHGKRSIVCFDKIHKKRRKLTPDCMGVAVNDMKFMIELDGPQHFDVVYHFNPQGSDLASQITSDLAKNRYAVDHGMSLLRVAYPEYKDLELWVNRFLDKCVQEQGKQVFLCSNAKLYNGQRDVDLGNSK